MAKIELRQRHGHGSTTLMTADSMEDILRFAAEKCGEEAIDDLIGDEHGG